MLRRTQNKKFSTYFILACTMMLTFSMNVCAQSGSTSHITGLVLDENEEPMIGVNVVLKGANTGTVTDLNGRFFIQATSKDVLEFHFIGYEDQEIKVGNSRTINISLRPASEFLDEIVVVGYSSVKKVNLTGAVDGVKGKDIAMKPVAQASNALVGVVPGLTAIQSSRQPGDDQAKLVIRGVGSLNSSTDPLVLIDGVEGDINSINPNDIDDISVLKDGASAAIYGSRSSNGVILITTKRAKEEGIHGRFSSYIGWQTPKNPKFVDALTYLKYMGYDQDYRDAYAEGMISNPNLYPNTDWVDEVFTESGFQQSYDLSVNSSSKSSNVTASLGYITQEGNVKNFGYDRFNGRINTDFKVLKNLTISMDASFYKAKRWNPTWGTSVAQALSRTVHQAYRLAAIYPAVYSDGSLADGFTGMNPVGFATSAGRTTRTTKNLNATLKAVYKPIEDLSLTVLYSPNINDVYLNAHQKQYETIMDWTSQTKRLYPDRNSLTQTSKRYTQQSFNALAQYTKTFGNHDIGALAGMEVITYDYADFNAGRQDFVLIDYPVLSAGSQETATNSGSATHWALVSFFGRLNYSFKGKYLLEATLRSDSSSRFAKDNRTSTFPSVSAAWRLSEEAFVKNLNIFSNLKLRLSWGQLGNQQIGGNFPYTSTFGVGNYNYMFNGVIVTGGKQGTASNEALKWETSESYNVGLDMGFFNNRLNFSGNYFIKDTKDMLMKLPVSSVLGLDAPFQNAGKIRNKGWEIALDWHDKIGELGYDVRFNIADVKNEVVDLCGVGPIITGSTITQEGYPIGMIYGYEADGIYQTQEEIDNGPTQFGTILPGYVKYKNQNPEEDNVIDEKDRVIIGDPFPRYSYGLNLGLTYKGFDVSVYFEGIGKRDVMLTQDLVQPLNNNGNISKWYLEHAWSETNTGAKYPLISTLGQANNYAASSQWVFDASYFRLRNLTVGYSVPQSWIKNKVLNNLRVYFSGANLFTTSNLPDGIDPMTKNDNNGGDIYPFTSTYTFGFELKF